jgi:D-alanine-D-alanine ligase
MDFRMNAQGQIFVLEANANPNLASGEDLAQSALAAGIGYDDLLERIMGLGLSYQAEWRAFYG